MRSIFLGSAILIVSVFAASAQVINAPEVGGPGGGPFDDPCRPGGVLVGYNVTSGKAMNQFAAVCQTQNNGVLEGEVYGLRTWGKNDDNGADHTVVAPRCPLGTAIRAMQIWVNKFNEIDSVEATCYALLPNTAGVASLPRTTTHGGQAVSNAETGCPPGTVAIGITGRSGALVDALGLKCSRFPWHVN